MYEEKRDQEKEIIHCGYSSIKLGCMEPVRRYLPMPQVTNMPMGDIHNMNMVGWLTAAKRNLALVNNNKAGSEL